MVDGEVAEGEHHPAAVAQPLLLTEQYVLVLPVWYGSVDVDPPRYIRPSCYVAVVEQGADPQGRGLLQPLIDQLNRPGR